MDDETELLLQNYDATLFAAMGIRPGLEAQMAPLFTFSGDDEDYAKYCPYQDSKMTMDCVTIPIEVPEYAPEHYQNKEGYRIHFKFFGHTLSTFNGLSSTLLYECACVKTQLRKINHWKMNNFVLYEGVLWMLRVDSKLDETSLCDHRYKPHGSDVTMTMEFLARCPDISDFICIDSISLEE